MGEKSFNFNFDKPVALLGLGIFLLGLMIRLIGVSWGLPGDLGHHSYHPDEEMNLGFSSVIDPAHLQFSPPRPVEHFYSYGTLYLTLENLATTVVSGYGGGSVEKDGSDYYRANAHFILAGRILNCLFGACVGWVIVATLFRRLGPWGAAAGGLACCFAPGMVVHSRFETVDVLATLLTALSLLYISRIAEGKLEGKDLTKTMVLAGIFAGLSAGTKYTGILLILALGACWLIGYRPKLASSAKDFAYACGAMVLSFILATPGSVTDTDRFLKDFKYEVVHSSTGHALVFAETSSGFLYHIGNLFATMGPLIVLIGVFGLGWATYRKHPWVAGALVFGVLYYLLIGRAEVKFLRYVFPLVPVIATGFGWFFSRIHAMPDPRWKILNGLAIAGLMGLDFGGLFGTMRYTIWMANPDVRDLVARKLISDQGSVGLVSDAWYYTPPVYTEAGASRAVPFSKRVALQESNLIKVMQVHDGDNRQEWDAKLVTDLKPDRIIFSSFEYDDYERIALTPGAESTYKDQIDRFKTFMAALNRDYEREEILGLDGPRIHDLMYIRPTEWVWKRKATLGTPSSSSLTTSAPSVEPAHTP